MQTPCSHFEPPAHSTAGEHAEFGGTKKQFILLRFDNKLIKIIAISHTKKLAEKDIYLPGRRTKASN